MLPQHQARSERQRRLDDLSPEALAEHERIMSLPFWTFMREQWNAEKQRSRTTGFWEELRLEFMVQLRRPQLWIVMMIFFPELRTTRILVLMFVLISLPGPPWEDTQENREWVDEWHLPRWFLVKRREKDEEGRQEDVKQDIEEGRRKDVMQDDEKGQRACDEKAPQGDRTDGKEEKALLELRTHV